jgi:hypothetical protein
MPNRKQRRKVLSLTSQPDLFFGKLIQRFGTVDNYENLN